MWKTVLAGTAALALVGSSLVYAQQGGPDRGPRGGERGPMGPEGGSSKL